MTGAPSRFRSNFYEVSHWELEERLGDLLSSGGGLRDGRLGRLPVEGAEKLAFAHTGGSDGKTAWNVYKIARRSETGQRDEAAALE